MDRETIQIQGLVLEGPKPLRLLATWMIATLLVGLAGSLLIFIGRGKGLLVTALYRRLLPRRRTESCIAPVWPHQRHRRLGSFDGN